MLLVILLLAGTLGFQDEEETTPTASMANSGMFLSWWTNDQTCKELGLTDTQRDSLRKDMNNFQISYQVNQTKLNDARKKQTEMFLDPSISQDKLKAFNKNEVARLSEQMQTTNFEARLHVRSKLSKEQLAAIAKNHTNFFKARWFQTSKVPVRQGKVIIKK